MSKYLGTAACAIATAAIFPWSFLHPSEFWHEPSVYVGGFILGLIIGLLASILYKKLDAMMVGMLTAVSSYAVFMLLGAWVINGAVGTLNPDWPKIGVDLINIAVIGWLGGLAFNVGSLIGTSSKS